MAGSSTSSRGSNGLTANVAGFRADQPFQLPNVSSTKNRGQDVTKTDSHQYSDLDWLDDLYPKRYQRDLHFPIDGAFKGDSRLQPSREDVRNKHLLPTDDHPESGNHSLNELIQNRHQPDLRFPTDAALTGGSRLRSSRAGIWNKTQRAKQYVASQDLLSQVQNNPDPQPNPTTMHDVQRATLNLNRHINLREISKHGVQRKRSHALVAGSEDAGDLPAPKRRSIQNVIRSGDGSVLSSSSRTLGNLPPCLPQAPSIREEDAAESRPSNRDSLLKRPRACFPGTAPSAKLFNSTGNTPIPQRRFTASDCIRNAVSGSVPSANPQESFEQTLRRKRSHALASWSDANDLPAPKRRDMRRRAADLDGKMDYRYVRPSGPREIQLVADALVATRRHFHQITVCEAPATPEHESYAVQHQILQEETRKVWLLGGKPPLLYRLGQWTGGFDNWHGHKIFDR